MRARNLDEIHIPERRQSSCAHWFGLSSRSEKQLSNGPSATMAICPSAARIVVAHYPAPKRNVGVQEELSNANWMAI